MAKKNSQENAQGKAQGQGNEKGKSKTTILTGVITSARNMYDLQLSKSNAIKLQCVENYMKSAYKDTDKFWADYSERVNKLLDSRNFERECVSRHLNPYAIAEHTVFLGPAVANNVLKNGLYKTLGEDVKLYNDGRFMPDKALRFVVDINNADYPHPSKSSKEDKTTKTDKQ